MRYLVLVLVLALASVAAADPPRFIALRVDAAGVVQGFHATSDPVPPDGMVLVPWEDFSRADLVQKPGKRLSVKHYRLTGSTIQRRTDAEVDAEDLAERQKEAKAELIAMKRQRRDLAEDVRGGDAEQGDLDQIDAKIVAKRAEIQGMR